MKRTSIMAAMCVFGMACNGSDSTTKGFVYGSPEPSTASEAAAATVAKERLASSFQFKTATDPATSAEAGLSAMALSNALLTALNLFPSTSPLTVGPLLDESWATSKSTQFAACLAESPPAPAPECYSASDTGVTYTNCPATMNGIAFDITGSVTRSGDTVSWDIAATTSLTGNSGNAPLTFDFTMHATGEITTTATAIQGGVRTDISTVLSGSDKDIALAFTESVDLDLAYSSDPFCITDGALEFKLLWKQKPETAIGPALGDLGLKFTWTGCDTVLVAHSN